MFISQQLGMLHAADPRDFRKIYDATMNLLFRVSFRIARTEDAAEDLCHEAYMKMYEKDMAFPSIDDAKFWLLRVIKNSSLNYAKRKERERKAYDKALKEDKREAETGETELLKMESKKRVQIALDKLPENLRSVIALKEYSEMNYKEIGEVLGISEGNVKVRVFRAREQLTKFLQKEDVYVP